jgi:hypothetical protein
MDTEFVNLYITRIVKEVEELTKSRLLNEARYAYLEKVNEELLKKIESLESQLDKQNKRKTKEVNTSDTF